MPVIANLDDLRERARRRLPKFLFEYVDGGADDEVTVRANRSAFERYPLRARALVDVSARDQSTTLLGEKLSTPLILGPAGLAGLLAPHGEVLAARAAASKGALFALSTMSVCSIEEVAAAAPQPMWFQLYVWKDRGITRALVERAKAAGYRALCLTVDVPDMGNRERDVRNGFVVPPRLTLSNVLDVLGHLGWVLRMTRSPRATFGNFAGLEALERKGAVSVAGFTNRQFDPSITWADLDWLRALWPGPVVLKGISCAEDARLAVEHGVQAIVVSNHGGRQLDGLPAAIDVLPEVADAVAGRAELHPRRRRAPGHGRGEGHRPGRARLHDRPALPLRARRRRPGRRGAGAGAAPPRDRSRARVSRLPPAGPAGSLVRAPGLPGRRGAPDPLSGGSGRRLGPAVSG